MTREPVKSSHIKAIGYDPEERHLEVEFHDGTCCRYLGVPPDLHRDLMASDSPGKMMHARVRGAYKHERIGERR